MTSSPIGKTDPSNMRRLIREFPSQVEQALIIGSAIAVPGSLGAIDSIVVAGLGGSAIGGDLLRSYAAGALKVPFHVVRNYELPAFVGPRTLVVASSYSGGTEETLAVHTEAMKRKAKIVCLTSNGELSRRAKKFRQPLIITPGGFPPRAALAFSFFPLLLLMKKLRLLRVSETDLEETLALLHKLSATCDRADNANNPALAIAQKIKGKLPVIYSSADRFDIVNLRWRGQIAENAKMLAFGYVYPEMNHNELVGWSGDALAKQMKQTAVVFLRDRDDHPRIALRMDITKSIIAKKSGAMVEVHSQGKSLLARTFSLVHIGDWVSFYLAMLNNVDPTPVKVIDYVKAELSKR